MTTTPNPTPKVTLSKALSYLTSGRHKKRTCFYSRLVSQLKRYASPGLGTMGVSIREGCYVLLYDPDIFEDGELTLDQLSIILMHEVLHLVLHHIPRFSRKLAGCQTDTQRRMMSSVANIAMDYAVNSLMVKLGEVTRKDFEDMGKYRGIYPTDSGLEEFKTMDWYIRELLADPDKCAQRVRHLVVCGEPGDSCSSSESSESSEPGESGEAPSTLEILEAYAGSPNAAMLEDLAKELATQSPEAKATLEEDLERTGAKLTLDTYSHEKSRGILPRGLVTLLEELLTPPTIPWQRLLKKAIVQARRYRKARSIRTPLRRIAIDDTDPLAEPCTFPGKKKNPAWTIIFAIDTSGSMSDEDVQDALAELRGVQKADAHIKIHVIEADAEIGREYPLTSYGKVKKDVTGRGGTDFNDVFKRARELDADMLIYATDGYAPMPERHNRIPKSKILWLISATGVYPGSYSRHRSQNKEEYGRAISIKSPRR